VTEKEKKRPSGRPTIYTEELGREICRTIACSSKGLNPLCSSNPHWPVRSTIFEWKLDNQIFSDMYDKAKAEQTECLLDDILEIADDSSNDTYVNEKGNVVCNTEYVNRSRLKIDARKWNMERLKPKKFGNKIENSISDGHKSLVEQILDKLGSF
jgi:hypothetical protein